MGKMYIYTIRFNEDEMCCLEKLMRKLNMRKSQIIRIAIRELAEKYGVECGCEKEELA
jgi:hypothetical protein